MTTIALALLGVQTTIAGALVYQTARSVDGEIEPGIALMVVGFAVGIAAAVRSGSTAGDRRTTHSGTSALLP